MSFSSEKLDKIFKRTDGNCHICRNSLLKKNYGDFDARGNWEVEHSIPQVKGGSDHLNNLYPACISCNRSKGDQPTSSARRKSGFKRAPLSSRQKDRRRTENGFTWGALGLVGAVLLRAHPVGMLVTTVGLFAFGSSIDVESE